MRLVITFLAPIQKSYIVPRWSDYDVYFVLVIHLPSASTSVIYLRNFRPKSFQDRRVRFNLSFSIKKLNKKWVLLTKKKMLYHKMLHHSLISRLRYVNFLLTRIRYNSKTKLSRTYVYRNFFYYLDVQRPLPKHCLLILRQLVYAIYYNFIIYTKNIIYAKVNKCIYVYLYSTSICVLYRHLFHWCFYRSKLSFQPF